MHHPFRSVRFRLVLLVLVAALPAWFVMIQMTLRERREATKVAQEYVLRVARLVADRHWKILEMGRGILMTLAHLPEIEDGTPGAGQELFRDVQDSFPGYYENFGMIDPQGNILASAIPLREPLNVGDRDYFREAATKRDFAVGSYQVGRITRRPSINIGYPVLSGENHSVFKGVVFGAINLGWIQQFVAAIEIRNSSIVISDSRGTVLAAYPPDLAKPGSVLPDTIVNLLRSSTRDGWQTVNINNADHYLAWVPIEPSPEGGRIFATVYTPVSLALAPVTREFLADMALLTAAAILTIAGAWYVGLTQLVRPLTAVRQAAKQIAAGDYAVRVADVASGGEVADLAHSFDEMAASLERTSRELSLAYDETLDGWSRALDFRDKETVGHTLRVTEVTLRLAHAMKLSADELVNIRRGSLLHDIGKMGIPDSILHKKSDLTEQEWAIMRKHPIYAYDLLFPIEYLRPALDIPYCHHERWDGKGYPRGLSGTEIPLSARIFSVVDAWDALRQDRPYRLGWSEERVLEYIRENSGTRFDPAVVSAFISLQQSVRQAVADVDFATKNVSAIW